MANIRLVGKSVSLPKDGSAAANITTGCAFAFELVDSDAMTKIPAKFGITTSASVLPMAGITEYGMLVGCLANADLSKSVTITAYPLDGSASVSVSKTFTQLIGLAVPSLVTG